MVEDDGCAGMVEEREREMRKMAMMEKQGSGFRVHWVLGSVSRERREKGLNEGRGVL